jgi:hypothetical protein
LGAGIDKEKASKFIDDENDGITDVKLLIQEQVGNGVDSVPTISFDGEKRDFTETGAKDTEHYLKIMEQIEKESA